MDSSDLVNKGRGFIIVVWILGSINDWSKRGKNETMNRAELAEQVVANVN